MGFFSGIVSAVKSIVSSVKGVISAVGKALTTGNPSDVNNAIAQIDNTINEVDKLIKLLEGPKKQKITTGAEDSGILPTWDEIKSGWKNMMLSRKKTDIIINYSINPRELTSKDEASKYIFGNIPYIKYQKSYFKSETENLPKTLAYEDNGYTYVYKLSKISQSFNGIELPEEPIELGNGKVIDPSLYGYKLIYTNEPQVYQGVVSIGEITKGVDTDALLKGIDRGNPETYYSYTELKKLIKDSGLSGSGKGLEAHHLLEKQFADVFGVNKNDIISIPLTPQWHRNVNSAMGNNIDNLINSELDNILTGTGKSSAGVEEIWEAHRNVYEKIGQSDWANAIYEAYVKKFNIPYK